MKKFYVLILTVAYLVFSTGSLQAEATIQENKDFQETFFSVKLAESASSHFIKAPHVGSAVSKPQTPTTHFVSNESVANTVKKVPVPIFLMNCNFRR